METVKSLWNKWTNSDTGGEFESFDFQLDFQSSLEQEKYFPSYANSNVQQTYKRRTGIERKDFNKLLQSLKAQVSEEVLCVIQSINLEKEVPCSKFVYKKLSSDQGEFGMVFITYNENKKLNLTVIHFQVHTSLNRNPTNEKIFFELNFDNPLCRDKIIRNQCFIVLEKEGLVESSQRVFVAKSPELEASYQVIESPEIQQAITGSNGGKNILSSGINGISSSEDLHKKTNPKLPQALNVSNHGINASIGKNRSYNNQSAQNKSRQWNRDVKPGRLQPEHPNLLNLSNNARMNTSNGKNDFQNKPKQERLNGSNHGQDISSRNEIQSKEFAGTTTNGINSKNGRNEIPRKESRYSSLQQMPNSTINSLQNDIKDM